MHTKFARVSFRPPRAEVSDAARARNQLEGACACDLLGVLRKEMKYLMRR